MNVHLFYKSKIPLILNIESATLKFTTELSTQPLHVLGLHFDFPWRTFCNSVYI